MVNFAIIDATSNAVANLNVAGVPPIVPKIVGLGINASKLALVTKLTDGLPAGIKTIASSYAKLSLTMQALALLPDLASGLGTGFLGTPQAQQYQNPNQYL